MRHSIRTRLTIGFIGLAIGPLLLVGVVIAWQSFLVQRAQALELQRQIAQQAATLVNHFVTDLEIELQTVIQFQNPNYLDHDQQQVILTKIQSNEDHLAELTLVDHQGQERVRVSRREAFIAQSLRNRSTADEFIIPTTSGRAYYSPISSDPETGEPTLMIAIPILDLQAGKPEGVLIATVWLREIWNILAGIRVGQRGQLYLVDPQGKVVAHHDPSVVLKGTTFDVPQNGISPGLNGGNVVLVSDTIQLKQQQLRIVTERPSSEALALTIRTILIIIALLGLALIAAYLLKILVVRQVVQPIEALVQTSQAISSGELSRRAEVKRDDELGALAGAFNTMAAQLQNLVGSLEQRVVQRTKELAQTNAELEAFAYSVSHDLRAPLRSMHGFSYILLESYADKLDAEAQEYLRRVCAASERMSRLINDLLHLSQITRQEIHRKPIDLSALAQSIATEFKQSQPERQSTFIIASGLRADGDPGLLQVALTNLIGNAWKFTSKQAQAQIEFGSTLCGDTTAFFVRDDGVGFDIAYANRLFSPFQRLHKATEFEGSGIGLATVQRIVRRHGGHVWAESAVGQGATFYFTL